MLEAAWHLIVSFTWGWFGMADTGHLGNYCRVVLVIVCISAWNKLLRGKDGATELRVLLRVLILVFVLQLFAMAWSVVEGERFAPSESCARFEANMSSLANVSSDSNLLCSASKILQWGGGVLNGVWGLLTLLFIAVAVRLVHSHVAVSGGATWAVREQQQTPMEGAAPAVEIEVQTADPTAGGSATARDVAAVEGTDTAGGAGGAGDAQGGSQGSPAAALAMPTPEEVAKVSV